VQWGDFGHVGIHCGGVAVELELVDKGVVEVEEVVGVVGDTCKYERQDAVLCGTASIDRHRRSKNDSPTCKQ
jgi:hypothetical protein